MSGLPADVAEPPAAVAPQPVAMQVQPVPQYVAPPMPAISAPAAPPAAVSAAPEPQAIIPLAEMEKHAIPRTLEFTANDVPRAAALLQVNPSTIYRKLQTWRAPVPA